MNFNMKKMVFTLLAIAIAVQGGILGHQAAVGYFCLMVIIYPIWIAMRIDRQKNRGELQVESAKELHWMNIKGIHFKEQVSHLKNLHFPSEQQMQIAYLQMLKLKVLFLSSLIALAIYNLITLTNIQQLHPTTVTPSMLLSPLVGLIILGFIMHILRNTLKLMSFINRREWYTSQYTLDGHTFYSAYFQDPEISDDEKKYIPFLDKVLAW